MAKISILETNEFWLCLVNGYLMKFHQSNGWLLLGLNCMSRMNMLTWQQYRCTKCATEVPNGDAIPAIDRSWCLCCSRMYSTQLLQEYKADGNVHIAEVPQSKMVPVRAIKVYEGEGWRCKFAYS